MDIEKVVENIQRACKNRGVTPTVAAKESGAGKDMVSALKKNGRIPSVERMSMLASYLGVTTSELLGEEKGPTPVSEGEPLYPPEYDLLTPEQKALIDQLIINLAQAKQSDSSPAKLYVAARDGSRYEVDLGEDLILPDESSDIPE